MFHQGFQPPQPFRQRREHLSVVIGVGKSITNGFSTHCPSEAVQMNDWLVKYRSYVAAAESGVQWTELLAPPNAQLPPLQVEVVVPYSEVFDCL